MKKYILFFLFWIPAVVFGQRIVNLSVNQLPEFKVLIRSLDTTLIKGNSFILGNNIQVSGGTGSYSYKWLPKAALSDSLIFHPIAKPSDTTLYLLSVKDANGCSFSVNYKVNVIAPDQSITLKSGWNIISFNRLPWKLNLKEVSQSLIIEESMIKVQDETGKALENFGAFGGWTNNIGNIFLTEGYKVKVTRDCQMHILGTQVNLPFTIPLKSGWNIIGYPKQAEAQAQAVVQQLIDRKTLIKVQDELGKSIEDWGAFGGWINNIGYFKPGRGYKIKVNSDDTLTIFESYAKSSASPMSQLFHKTTTHFKPAISGNGLDHMNFNIVAIPTGFFEDGDEMGVFDGNNCVGAFKSTFSSPQSAVHNQKSAIRSLSIPVSANDDLNERDGFTQGHPFSLRIWKAESNKEYTIEPVIITGPSTFVKHESVFVSLAEYAITGLGKSELPAGMELNIYPNPSDGKIYIQYSGMPSTGIRILALNLLGQQLLSRSLDTNPGVIDLSGQASGVYFIQVLGDFWSKTEKIVLK